MPKQPARPEDARVDDSTFPGNGWPSAVLLVHKQSSKDVYEAMWRAYLVYLARRGKDAVSARQEDVLTWLQGYPRTSAMRRARFFSDVYTCAQENGLCSHNPIAGLALMGEIEPRPAAVVFPVIHAEELIRIMEEPADWEVQRDQTVLVLVLAAGLRFDELRTLKLSALQELSSGCLQVSIDSHVVAVRDLVIDECSTRFLRKWLETRAGLGLIGEEVFPARRGGPVPASTLDRRVRRMLQNLKTAGSLPRGGLGVLRNAFVKQHLETHSLGATQRAAGHRRLVSMLQLAQKLKGANLRGNS